MKMNERILVIDDEQSIRDSLKMVLEYEGYEYLSAADGKEGIKLAVDQTPDLILLDIKMPKMDGLEVLKELNNKLSELPPVIVISGHGTISTAVEAIKLGAFNFLEKPLERQKVLLDIKNALEQRRLQEENRDLRIRFEQKYEMIGMSDAMQKLWQSIERAAPTSATILITGESGTGKELAARAIHKSSQRSNRPFIQVNCAAIPDDLIESELFGHEKGSFTGATEKKLGKFELADKATVFLDEVADMSMKTQAKVLRVLQEGEVQRIGSSKIIKVDVRVIAATNRDLKNEIEKNLFRDDLYFRLNVIPIHCPPLREHTSDIPLLANHFVRRFCRENNFKEKKISKNAMDSLMKYPWPGNVRELENTIERLVIMTPGETIVPEQLPENIPGKAPILVGSITSASNLKEFKEEAEKTFILAKLRENNWNILKTARQLGTPRSNLYKKLKQYDIEVPE
jgi:two-component system nitrogen regulation response regulator NtrX